ncbi:MAG: hypothetical protein K0S09_2338 [Sphingobacteriaceae bacterium]|jgi:hypothetical protein|nr:hypothetical protein [Sphingobacteriaceae bacterium]
MHKAFSSLLFLSLGALFISGKADELPPTFDNCKRCAILAEQSVNRIAIADLDKQEIVWSWYPNKAGINSNHLSWFRAPSDAKVVYGGQFILMTASGGGVALIRIADKKAVFYAYAGSNPHSAELLPDGNIVTASSTGNYLKIFSVDTLQSSDKVYSKTIPIAFGHNVVWDKKNRVLWSAANDQLKRYIYNFNKHQPDLILKGSIPLPGSEAHDLFPVYGENALWLSNPTGVYKFDVATRKIQQIPNLFHDIKSVTSGPKDYPVMITHPDTTPKSWWTDEVNSLDGKVLFKSTGLKIYKARWFLQNQFSYDKALKFNLHK